MKNACVPVIMCMMMLWFPSLRVWYIFRLKYEMLIKFCADCGCKGPNLIIHFHSPSHFRCRNTLHPKNYALGGLVLLCFVSCQCHPYTENYWHCRNHNKYQEIHHTNPHKWSHNLYLIKHYKPYACFVSDDICAVINQTRVYSVPDMRYLMCSYMALMVRKLDRTWLMYCTMISLWSWMLYICM